MIKRYDANERVIRHTLLGKMTQIMRWNDADCNSNHRGL